MKNNDIKINAITQYLESHSEPEAGRYVFAYTITIYNEGDEPSKLLSRHWVITDAEGRKQEVRGEGVVGEQPHLLPGEYFRYSSAAMIGTPVGIMQGEYQMVTDKGEVFETEIPAFTLAMPRTLH
jgi:ApaG protein